MFLLLGIFVMCLFVQPVQAQQKSKNQEPTKELRSLRKGDKIVTQGGKRTVVEGEKSATPRPNQAKRPTPQKRPNQAKKPTIKQRPAVNKTPVKKPQNVANKNLRPAAKKAGKTQTKGRVSGIKRGNRVGRARSLSPQNAKAMQVGHGKLKGMRTKLNAAKAKVAKEKAANPNSIEVKQKEARIRQAEAKIKAMEQELVNQRTTITKLQNQ